MERKKLSGKDVKIYIVDDEQEEIIGGQQSGTFARTAGSLDASSKDDEDGYGDFLPGMKGWTISSGGAYVENDPAIDHMEECYENDEPVALIYKFKSGRAYKGRGVLTSFSIEAPHDGIVSVSYEFQGKGKPNLIKAGETGNQEAGTGGAQGQSLSVEPNADHLSTLTKTELITIAGESGIDVPSSATKDDIIALILG